MAPRGEIALSDLVCAPLPRHQTPEIPLSRENTAKQAATQHNHRLNIQAGRPPSCEDSTGCICSVGSAAPALRPCWAARELGRPLSQRCERVSREGAELARSLGVDAAPLAVPDDGDIPRTILHVARECQAAAIVVGSRGLSGL